MKKFIAIAIVGSLFSVPAMAQNSNGTLGALLGGDGAVVGLITTLTTANFNPLIDGAASMNQTGTVRGGIAAPLDNTLTALLVNQDPGGVASGLQNTLTLTVDALLNGLVGNSDPQQLPNILTGLLTGLAPSGGAGGLPGIPGLGALPGLDSLPGLGSLPGLDSLPSLPGLGGA